MGAATPAEELDVGGVAVRLSNPDKIYFPALGAEGGTKRHLVEYYRTVALDGAVITALRDRPTYLQRFPDGIEREEIYQKRVPRHAPDYVGTCRVPFPSGRHADALRVQGPAEVVWAANSGSVTFHPWPSRCDDTEHPDELRIDLDPQPGTGFAEARSLALDVIRPLLDEHGLAGYPKTSGGRGVHVYVRIERRWGHREVRRAALGIAREAEQRAGDRVTTAWWRADRTGGIFVDYNQNARDHTIASAYSVRRTPRATVSCPLTWDELADADPDDLTIATVPALLARRPDPMAGLDSVAHDLSSLLELAERHGADEDEAPPRRRRSWWPKPESAAGPAAPTAPAGPQAG